MQENRTILTPMDENDLIRCREIAATSAANDLMQIEKNLMKNVLE
jgi:hypothetical protein